MIYEWISTEPIRVEDPVQCQQLIPSTNFRMSTEYLSVRCLADDAFDHIGRFECDKIWHLVGGGLCSETKRIDGRIPILGWSTLIDRNKCVAFSWVSEHRMLWKPTRNPTSVNWLTDAFLNRALAKWFSFLLDSTIWRLLILSASR